jgi:FkbM family methyltransferase
MVFVDIGVNSGLVSLFAAGNKDVWKIYGFAPFRAPFQRALANFQLNPTIAAKIDPKNIALGDSNRSVEVLESIRDHIGV